MPRNKIALTDATIKQLELPLSGSRKVTDGQVPGLCLQVFPSGQKLWRLRYVNELGKETTLGLGAYPTALTLKEAREKAEVIRHGLANGEYPVGKRMRKLLPGVTFQAVAEDWARQFLVRPHKAASSIKRDKITLDKHILPVLGQMPIKAIKTVTLVNLLKPISARKKGETFSRVRILCGQIFRYAVCNGVIPYDPTLGLKGAFPAPVTKHYAAITDPAEVGAFMKALWAYPGDAVVGIALKMLAYVFTRPGELRLAEWKEIKWDDRLWDIPAARMKMRQPHIVPLSTQMLELLRALKEYTGKGRYLFTLGGPQPFHALVFNHALKAIGYKPDVITPHGFRSMASTLLNQKGFNPDWIERELAHDDVNKIRAIYNRAAYLQERRAMMQDWADYLDELRAKAN